jgi:hypothetical protein
MNGSLGRSEIIRVTGKSMVLVAALILPTISTARDYGYSAGSYPSYQQPGPQAFDQQTHFGEYGFRPPSVGQPKNTGQSIEDSPSHGWSPSQYPEAGQPFRFRDVPTQTVEPYPIFRPQSRGGRSNYTWHADDGSIGPAPVFRPMDGDDKRSSPKRWERPEKPPQYGYPAQPIAPYVPNYAPVAPKFRPIP